MADIVLEGPASFAGSRKGLSQLIDEQSFESGLISCNFDLLAHRVIIEAHARGIAVPDRIAVIGVGDQDFAAHTAASIMTVRIDREALGQAAAQVILRSLKESRPRCCRERGGVSGLA